MMISDNQHRQIVLNAVSDHAGERDDGLLSHYLSVCR